jgi:uncharacterized cofD-like protein
LNLWRNSLKWLYPGLRLKRWIAVGFCGLLLFLIGMGVIIEAHAADSDPLAVRVAKWVIRHSYVNLRPGALGILITFIGGFLCLFALGKLIASLASALDPDMRPGELVDVIYSQRKLAQGRRIVVIGGGTGLSTMLRGLKKYSANITAIVTVADDGGSSGKLQKQLNILPPGDIRNCLVALADDETQMTELFQYRFRNSVQPESAVGVNRHILHASAVEALHGVTDGTENSAPPRPRPTNTEGYGEGLRDHAFGNLLIAAMTAINNGDFEKAIQETSRVLNVRGRVLPSTVEHVKLRGEMEDGSFLEGETTIANSPLRIRRIYMVPEKPCPVEEVPEAIRSADVIVLGPGSVFTSIIPNLLVQGVSEVLAQSRAKKVYVCNVMTQPGETDNFSAFDHVKTLENHAGRRIFDYVLVNTGRPSQELLEKYRKTGSVLVEADLDRIRAAGYRAIAGNFIDQTDVVRHDANLLAEAIMDLLK